MQPDLFTPKYVDEICKSMLIIDCIKKHPDLYEDSEQIKNYFDDLCETIGEIMEELTEEQRDHILERHSLNIKNKR